MEGREEHGAATFSCLTCLQLSAPHCPGRASRRCLMVKGLSATCPGPSHGSWLTWPGHHVAEGPGDKSSSTRPWASLGHGCTVGSVLLLRPGPVNQVSHITFVPPELIRAEGTGLRMSCTHSPLCRTLSTTWFTRFNPHTVRQGQGHNPRDGQEKAESSGKGSSHPVVDTKPSSRALPAPLRVRDQGCF